MTRARLGALLALLAVGAAVVPARAATEPSADGALVVLVPGVSLERLLSDPDLRALASNGGAAVMSPGSDAATALASAFPNAGISPLPTGTTDTRFQIVEQGFGPAPAPLEDLGREVRRKVERDLGGLGRVLVVVAGLPAEGGANAGDLVPVVVAEGPPGELFREDGDPRALSSDSTRRAGVVTVDDLPTTIVDRLGHPVPGEPAGLSDGGQPIRIVDAPVPVELHQRYLEQRRLYVPIGTAAIVYVVLAGAFGIGLLILGGRAELRFARVAGWSALAVPALATSLLAVGHLSDLTYASVLPFVLLVTVLGTLAFSPLERLDLTLVPAGIGAAVLAFFAIEAMFGWTAFLTPLLGGSQLDGGRYYGLPNVAIGLLIGASLWVAQRLPTVWGFVLLCVVALFAGLPLLGTNLGGGVSLFATAGLWVAVRERVRLGRWKAVAVAVAVAVGGTALLLVAHAISPVTTHVTEFERTAGGPSGVLGKVWDRLQVGSDLIARNPVALVPVVGLLVCLVVIRRAPGAIGASFRRWPAWRDALLVTLLGGVVAYLANDSGPAAAGLAFGLGLAGMVGVSLLALPAKMGTDG